RFAVHRMEDDVFRFTVTELHAILDGWSLTLLLRDLLTQHDRIVDGEDEPPVPPGGATFRDFIALEQAALGSPACRDFWREHLRGVTPARLQRWPDSGSADGDRQAW